jgi:hypothetical protein
VYTGREIAFGPVGRLDDFVLEIKSRYVGKNGCFDNKFSDVSAYDGSANGKTIYKLNEASNLINTEYSNLIDALANLNQEIDPLEMKASAYVLSGHFENEDEFVPIKIIAMQNPITLPKHKFMQIKGKFKESDE